MTSQQQPETQLGPDISITSGSPSETEIAAVTAVLSAMLEELADERGQAERVGVSAWARSQQPIRGELRPGQGAWRGFPG